MLPNDPVVTWWHLIYRPGLYICQSASRTIHKPIGTPGWLINTRSGGKTSVRQMDGVAGRRATFPWLTDAMAMAVWKEGRSLNHLGLRCNVMPDCVGLTMGGTLSVKHSVPSLPLPPLWSQTFSVPQWGKREGRDPDRQRSGISSGITN